MHSSVILLSLAVTSPVIGQDLQCAQELYRPSQALCANNKFIDISDICRYL